MSPESLRVSNATSQDQKDFADHAARSALKVQAREAHVAASRLPDAANKPPMPERSKP